MASNLQDSNSELGSFAECGICSEDYDADVQSKKPYVLQCGHTYCKQCLDQVSACPFCRKPFREKTPNFLVISLLEKENERRRVNILARLSTNLEETRLMVEQANGSRDARLKTKNEVIQRHYESISCEIQNQTRVVIEKVLENQENLLADLQELKEREAKQILAEENSTGRKLKELEKSIKNPARQLSLNELENIEKELQNVSTIINQESTAESDSNIFFKSCPINQSYVGEIVEKPSRVEGAHINQVIQLQQQPQQQTAQSQTTTTESRGLISLARPARSNWQRK